MSSFSNPTFLSHLKSLYPESGLHNPWYIIATVGFAASNRPEAIPLVFQHVMKDMEGSSHDDKISVVRKLRDALLKAGMMSGYPKVINGMKSLYDVTPEELRDSTTLRDVSLSASEIDERGRAFFQQAHGNTADSVKSFLDTVYPDVGWFSTFVAYGIVYSFDGALTHTETSYALCAALIASDTPMQIGWHLNGAMRNGATLEQVKGVRAIAIEVAKASGVTWINEVPEVEAEDA